MLIVRRLLLVLAASLVLAGAFGAVVSATGVDATARRGVEAPVRSTPVDPRLCTIGQRCAPAAPNGTAGPVSVPGTLAFFGGVVVLPSLPRRRRRSGPARTTGGDVAVGIFRPPIASLA